MKQHIFWHLLQKFRSHSEVCNTPRKICCNNFCLPAAKEQKYRTCVCLCVWRERESECVYVPDSNKNWNIFVLFQNLLCRNVHKFRAQTFSSFQKKDKQRLIVGARGRGLAKRLRAHCTHVSGHKSAITSQAGHEFHLAFCVANLSGKLRTLMNCFYRCIMLLFLGNLL